MFASAMLALLLLFPVHTFAADAKPVMLECELLDQLAGTNQDGSSALQACLDQAPPGAEVDIMPGLYLLLKPIEINQPITLAPRGVASSAPACDAVTTDQCVSFVVDMVDYARTPTHDPSKLPILINGKHVSMHHFIFSGVKGRKIADDEEICGSTSTVKLGGGLFVAGDNFTLSKSVLRNFTCYTSFGTQSHVAGLVFTNNLISSNGNHLGFGPSHKGSWSDGVTIADSKNARIEHNNFVDNTDVQLIFGGCQACMIDHNAFYHSAQSQGGAFAELMLHAWPKESTSGDYTGTVVSDNSIDCGVLKNCGFGLMLGPDPWYEAATFKGTVRDNTVKNAMIGLIVDNISGPMTVIDNDITRSGGQFVSSCGVRNTPAINVTTASSAFVEGDRIALSLSAPIESEEFSGCILNHMMSKAANENGDPRIVRAYREILGHDPDAPGLDAYSEVLEDGDSLYTVRASIAGSVESTDHIRALYKSLELGAPSKSEVVNAVQQMADGLSLDQLRIVVGQNQSIVTGSEGNRALNLVYQEILRRDPDAPGAASFENFLRKGGDIGTVRASVAYSLESESNVQALFQKYRQKPAIPAQLAIAERILANGGSFNGLEMLVAEGDF